MTLLTDREPFDVCGPLPRGITVLEASAGTGKTFTIAALAARYVADGTPLDDLLLVTFTRMATGELRERVRERLESAERALGAVLEGAAPDARDEVVRLLAAGPREAVALRHRRLARALSDFDAATITTTHGFCQEVLGGLGVAGDTPRDGAFAEEVRDLLEEVVDDLYVRRFRTTDRTPEISRAQAFQVAEIAVGHPGVPVEPQDDGEPLPAMRRRLAEAARGELERRKQQLAVMTYDDLLTGLQRVLQPPGGAAVARRLHARYPVVLVDEFQDTDPIQWEILQKAFGAGTLVLIGDPKQAIYAFRGADVYAYLDAARSAVAHATLRVNWRSDQGLIDAYDALFDGAQLGHEGIVYRRVLRRGRQPRAAPDRRGGAAARARRPPRRAGGRAHAARLRQERLRAGVHRPRPRGRRRPAARGGGGDRDPRRRRRGGGPRRGRARRRRRARAHEPRRRRGPRRARRRRGPGGDQRRGQRVRDRGRGPLAAAARRAGAAGLRPARARRGAHAVPRLARGAGRVRRGARVGGGPPPAARLGARPAPARRRRPGGDRQPRAGAPGARALAAGRRARADRPAPRRAAAARRRDDRAARDDRARRLAAAADRRGRRRHRRRGAQPPARVRRRRRPGPHRPPQQGARVPDRVLPRPVGAGLHPALRPGRLPRPRRGRPAHDRRRAGGRGVRAPQGAGAGRAARRGPAAGLRGADPRAPPGGGLVGGLVRQPQLGARAAAVRTRGGRRDRRGRDEHADRQQGRRALRRARRGRAGPDRRRARAAGPAGRLGRVAARDRRADRLALRARARPALAPHLLQRHHRRCARGARGQRARGGRHRRRAGARDAAAGGPRRRRGAARGPVAARRDARGRGHRHVRPRGPGGDGLRRAGPDRGADRARRRGARPAPARDRRRRRPPSPGCAPRSRRRSARSWAACGSPTCVAPTGSTS